jgi:SAM-dependent methyltransferase
MTLQTPGAVSGPLEVYEAILERADDRGVQARFADGTVWDLPIERWVNHADEVDLHALDALGEPVIDIGCGPGRHLQALSGRGVKVWGIDPSPLAVKLARRTGARVVLGSVFDDMPLTGRWGSALLLDGNIGIGGDAARLLQRVHALLRPGGTAVVELSPPGTRGGSTRMRLETPSLSSDWFAWATVSASEIDAMAAALRFGIVDRWSRQDRWFVTMAKAPSPLPLAVAKPVANPGSEGSSAPLGDRRAQRSGRAVGEAEAHGCP